MLLQRKIFAINCSKFLCRYMSLTTTMRESLIAVAQLASTSDKPENLLRVQELIKDASDQNAKMIFFPEGCDYIGNDVADIMEQTERIDGVLVSKYCNLAEKYNIWLSFGGIHINNINSTGLLNTHLVINNLGKIVAKYTKTHLYDADILKSRQLHMESIYTEFGKHFTPPVDTICGKMSLGICYDLRFPEMSIIQRRLGAEILTFPSAFNGRAHWYTLLIARAIETQCYVVAAAQVGKHNRHRVSFGHSLVVNPWGEVIAEKKNGCGIIMAKIDLNYLKEVRKKMPVMLHRRPDIYRLYSVSRNEEQPCVVEQLPIPSDYCQHTFGNVFIPGSCIVLKTFSSFACVNKKPISENHLLVIPDRPAELLKDLNLNEVCDFAQSVFLSFLMLDRIKYKCDISLGIQDGENSGQTIKHLHVHLVPSIKNSVQKHVCEDESDRLWRDQSNMEMEANILRMCYHTGKENLDHFMDELPQEVELLVATKIEYKVKNFKCHYKSLLFSTKTCVVLQAPLSNMEGHILLCFDKKSKRFFKELNAGEICDLFQCLQIIERQLMQIFVTNSVTIYSKININTEIKNVIFHIVPRKKNDLKENDKIYTLFTDYEENLSPFNFVSPLQEDWTHKFIYNIQEEYFNKNTK